MSININHFRKTKIVHNFCTQKGQNCIQLYTILAFKIILSAKGLNSGFPLSHLGTHCYENENNNNHKSGFQKSKGIPVILYHSVIGVNC